MANPYFRFKQFVIYQDRCAMKVGTDGVLLGAWAGCGNAQSILDIGSGTGLIALMLAQRSSALVDAVEIDVEAAIQAEENAQASPYSSRIQLHALSLQEFVKQTEKKYDLIVSNPPYFNNSHKSPKATRTQARHTDTLSFVELLESVKQMLAENGRFEVVLPIDEGEMFISKALELGLFCVKRTNVIPKPNAQVKRLLLSFALSESDCVVEELQIEGEQRHQYSDEFKAMTKDFYLDK